MIKYNKLDRWTFEFDVGELVSLVLDNKKIATHLYMKLTVCR